MKNLKERIEKYIPDVLIIGGLIYLLHLLLKDSSPDVFEGPDNIFELLSQTGKNEVLLVITLILIGLDIAIRRVLYESNKGG